MTEEEKRYDCKFEGGDFLKVPSTSGEPLYYLVIDLYEESGVHYVVVDLKTEQITQAFVPVFDERAEKVGSVSDSLFDECIVDKQLNCSKALEKLV